MHGYLEDIDIRNESMNRNFAKLQGCRIFNLQLDKQQSSQVLENILENLRTASCRAMSNSLIWYGTVAFFKYWEGN